MTRRAGFGDYPALLSLARILRRHRVETCVLDRSEDEVAWVRNL